MLHSCWTSLYLHPFNCTTSFSAEEHFAFTSLFLNVPAPLSHYSCLLVFFFRCLTFPWAPFSPFSLIASVLPASPFLSYPGVYLCTRSFYFSYGFKCLPSLSPPSVPFFVFVFLFLFLSSFSHVGLLRSCPPYCQSAFTHPAFISISPQGDLGRTHLLSLYRSQSSCLNSSAFPF